jgi:membrane protein insertase Oxa1/YidC/SpoIIIJ
MSSPISIMLSVLAVVLAVAFFAGGIFLQIHLSKRKHWLPGLILPLIGLLSPVLVAILAFLIFSLSAPRAEVEAIPYDYHEGEPIPSGDDPVSGTAVAVLPLMFVFALPMAGVYLVIYFVCRHSMKKPVPPDSPGSPDSRASSAKELDMMKLQDL